MPIKAVIFDFDGLILDTETAEYETWREIYEEHGLELPMSLWASNVGGYTYEHFHPYNYLAENTGVAIDLAWLGAERERRHLEKVHAAPILPGVEEAFAHLLSSNLQIALASSSDSDWVYGHTGRLGIRGHFHTICCGDMVEQCKPDPALYMMALERLGLSPAEAFALEDSAKGVAAAKAAGLYCVAVTNPVSEHLDLSAADMVLGSLAEVPFAELIRQIEGER